MVVLQQQQQQQQRAAMRARRRGVATLHQITVTERPDGAPPWRNALQGMGQPYAP